MNTTQAEFTFRRGGRTQGERILEALEARRGEWIPMPELAAAGSGTPGGFCMVHSRVADLRRAGHVIGHRNEWVDRQCHSYYRLE